MVGTPKVWFITGASTGFGRVLAEEAAQAGALVAATARRPETLEGLAAKFPDQVLALRVDVTDHASIEAAVKETLGRWGRIDVLANNAGYGMMGAVEVPSWEDIRAQYETNVFGAIAVLRAVLPAMRAQRSGRILNISSIVGLVSYAYSAFYAGTKHALEAVNESLAAETAPFGIKVTSVEPGPFRTDFAGRSLVAPDNTIPDYQPMDEAVKERYASMDGNQAGDPVRAARIMLKVADAENPPLRLPLGRFAYEEIKLYTTQLLDEMEAWKDDILAADYPDQEVMAAPR